MIGQERAAAAVMTGRDEAVLDAGEAALGTISVVIPTYGHAAYIGRALESVLRQTRPAHEIVVINDGSPDDTAAAVAPYRDRIRYVEQENRGIGRTRTRGVELAAGDYLLMLDSDDWLEEDALATLGEVLDANPDVALAHGGMTTAEADGTVRGGRSGPGYPRGKHREVVRLIGENYLRVPSTLCRRAALVAAGPFPEERWAEDWGMWLQVALAGWSFFGVEREVFVCRRHGANLTSPRNLAPELAAQQRLIDDLYRAHRARLTPEERRAFARSRQWIRRSRGWVGLAAGDRVGARAAFAGSLVARPSLNAAAGLALAALPARCYGWIGRQRPLPFAHGAA